MVVLPLHYGRLHHVYHHHYRLYLLSNQSFESSLRHTSSTFQWFVVCLQQISVIRIVSQNEDIETLVLSGKLFGNQSRSSSPERTPSPDSGWHDEELNHRQGAPGNSDSDADGNDKTAAREEPSKESIGMGPGRTGVKGVIRDRNEALSRERDRQKRDIDELNAKLEKSTLGGKTYLDEEREKARIPGYEGKVDELIVKERELMQALKGGKGDKRDMFGRRKEGRFGHLREVGAEGFVDCIDEDRGVWVLVHLYDQVRRL